MSVAGGHNSRRGFLAWEDARVSEPDETRMTFGEHLEELRRRLLYALAGPVVGFLVCFVFLRDRLLAAIVSPVYPHWRLFGHTILRIERVPVEFTLSTPYSVFMTSMFVALVVGIIFTAPWSLYHIWAFMAVGLKPRERRWIRLFGPASVLLFAAGASFFYFVVYPMVVHFLYGFGRQFNEFLAASGGEPMMSNNTLFDGYVYFVMLLTLVFGLMFELPLVVFFLGKTGLVDAATFARYRRHVIVSLVFVAAMVTPPDVFSQVALAVPMMILYELGILLVRLSDRQRRKASQ